MTQFHEGQEVEVHMWSREWHKAKITSGYDSANGKWEVEFPDHTLAVFDADHVKRAPCAQEFYSDLSNADWAK